MFRSRAAQARTAAPTPSNRAALRFLGGGGTVLDVGAGGGAASLPLAGAARRIVAVDESEGMTEAFLAAAAEAGVEAAAVLGRWPDVAAKVDPADFLRRRLCLPADRDPEIAEALAPIAVHEAAGWRLGPLDRPVVTLSWPGMVS